MMIKRRVSALLTMIILVLMSGCGPIMSTSNLENAKDAIAKADGVDAATRAPYEYYMAQEYYRKASELWGYSQFGYSAEYAQKAFDMAKAATEKATTSPWKSPLLGQN